MPKILVADDNSNIQKMVALALKDLGVEVVGVGHGEAAVRKLPEVKPDLILADVFMPVRNGYEVCEFVKKDDRFSRIPVVLLVGAFDPIDEHEVKRVRADGILNKPFVPVDKLLEMVKFMLAKSAEAQAPPAAKAPEAPIGETVELTPEEMREIAEKAGAAPEMEVTPGEEVPGRPKPLEFEAGEHPVTFEGFGTPVAEIRPEVEEEEAEAGEEEGEEETLEEATLPLAGESAFAAGAIEEHEKAEVSPPLAPESPAEAVSSAAPETEPSTYAVEEQPETPQWGGIETPPRQPAPDEPPIPVSFEGSGEEVEIVREESAGASAYIDAGPPPELATSTQEFMGAAPPAPPAAKSPFDDTQIIPPISAEEIAAAARRAEVRRQEAAAREAAEAAAEAATATEEIHALAPELASAQAEVASAFEVSAPSPPVRELAAHEMGVPSLEEAVAPAAIAGAAALGYAALGATPAHPEAAEAAPALTGLHAPAASETAETVEEVEVEEEEFGAPETSTVVFTPAEEAPRRSMLTGDTDVLARPKVDEGLVDAVADRVIERLQGGMLNKLTKDILRPIIEALIAQELDRKP